MYKQVTTHMKKITYYIFTILILITTKGFSQSDFSKIDEYARSIEYNPNKSLAKELTKNFTTDLEKVRAIFVWITDNIEYDFELFQSPELQEEIYTSTNDVIDHTLNTKKQFAVAIHSF